MVMIESIPDEGRHSLSSEVWIRAFVGTFTTLEIECVPGYMRQKLVETRIIQLSTNPAGGIRNPNTQLRLIPGGQAIIGIQGLDQNIRHQDVYSLQEPFPFSKIPKLLKGRFRRKVSVWKSSKTKATELLAQHMQYAYDLLDPDSDLVQLILIISSALCLSSPIPRTEQPPGWDGVRSIVDYSSHGKDHSDKAL